MPLFSSAAASLRASTLTQRLLALLALGLLLHLVFGSLLTLSVDEAHYALYADKLALSYFDHPPLVGWLQWPLVALGVPDGVLRLIPQLLWLAACLIARDLTLQLPLVVPAWQTDPHSKEVAGLWAVALVLLAPLLHVLGVGLLPDTLLMVLSLLLMQVALKLSTTPQTAHTTQTRLRLWMSAGVLLGLAGLSKYTAILPAAALILTLSSTQGLRWLLSPGPWLALVIACCLVSPVFYWNAQHEWVSFVYQLNHGSGGQWRARRLLAFVGLQLVAYGPLLFLGGYLALRQLAGGRNWPALGLLSFFLMPFFVAVCRTGPGQPGWHWFPLPHRHWPPIGARANISGSSPSCARKPLSACWPLSHCSLLESPGSASNTPGAKKTRSPICGAGMLPEPVRANWHGPYTYRRFQ